MEGADKLDETARRFVNEIATELQGRITPRARRLACEELEAIAMHTENAELRTLALDVIARSSAQDAPHARVGGRG